MAKNASNLIGNYSQLSPANTKGDFDGKLSNNVERLVLTLPPKERACGSASQVEIQMPIEVIPLIAAVLVGLVGLGLLFDAWTPDEIIVKNERRRRPRVERGA